MFVQLKVKEKRTGNKIMIIIGCQEILFYARQKFARLFKAERMESLFKSSIWERVSD